MRALDVVLGALVLLNLWVLLSDGFAQSVAGVRVSVRSPQDVLLTTVAVLALRWALALPAPDLRRPGRLVAAGVVVYTLVFSLISLGQHWTFRTHAMDLGYYVQVVWMLGHGLTPHETLLEQHAWAGHLSPILYLLAPLGRLPRVAEALLVFQALALALGAVPLYLMARPRLGAAMASALAVLYLLNPSLHGITTKDFHTAALAIPLLLTAMCAVDDGRWWLFWPAAILTLATREDAGIAVVGLGLWILLARRHGALGLAVTGLGLAWLFASVEWIVPFFRGGPYPYFTARYADLGDSLGAVVLSPLLRPRAVLLSLLSAERLRYLAALLAPLGFLPMAAPLSAAGAVPALAQNLLSIEPVLFNYRSQYQSFVLPFLLVAAASGLQALARRERGRVKPRHVLAIAVLTSLVLSARTVNALAVSRWWPGEGPRSAERLMASIPPDASVTTQERPFAHLAQRRYVYRFPNGLDRSQYAFVNGGRLGAGEIGRVPARREDSVVTILPPGPGSRRPYRFEVVDEAGGFLLLRPAPTPP